MLIWHGWRLFISELAFAASLAAICLQPATAAPRKAAGPCPAHGELHARVAGVDERLDIALEDGRILHLVGIDPVRPTPESPERDIEARDLLAEKIRGFDIDFKPLAQKPDRWGRIPVFGFFAAPEGNERSIGFYLLAAGLARLKPQAEIHSCRDNWLTAEARARSMALGLWADPYYAIIAAGDGSAFAEKAATDVIVEGRLKAAVSGKTGLRLEFGPNIDPKIDPKNGSKSGADLGRGFSVIILQRNLRIFDQANMKFEPLIGRNVRVRGLLDMRFGPQIEIASPDEIEVSDGEIGKAQLEVRANETNAITPISPEDP